MPNTIKAHHVGEAGTSAVLKYCNSFGWIGEHVRIDFGEDLVFQTNFKGRIDPFRIYAQCKSVSDRPQRVTISRDHLLKWSLMVELVILFVYSKRFDQIFYYEINERKPFSEIWGSSQKYFSIPVRELKKLDAKAIKRLEWLSRMRGMSFIISQHISSRSIFEAIKDADPAIPKNYSAILNESEAGLFYQFFQYLELLTSKKGHYAIDRKGKLANFMERIRRRASGKIELSQQPLTIREALLLIIMYEWQIVTGGLGINIMIGEGLAFWLEVFVLADLVEEGFSLSEMHKLRL